MVHRGQLDLARTQLGGGHLGCRGLHRRGPANLTAGPTARRPSWLRHWARASRQPSSPQPLPATAKHLGVPVRFEAVAPVRAFPSFKRQRYFPGLWWSATTRRQVGYEAWLERDHLMLLDHDPAVVGIASQPFWLFWQHDGKLRSHAPDYFARRVVADHHSPGK